MSNNSDNEDGFLKLSQNLANWLDQSGTSVRAAARMSGIHRSVIQRHRDGLFSGMTAHNLVRFAHLIGAHSWDDLLGPLPPADVEAETAYLLGDTRLLSAIRDSADAENLVPYTPENGATE